MGRPLDLYAAFQVLDPHEREIILAWEEEIGAELESVPPLVALVTMLATVRVAGTLDGSIEARFSEAGTQLGIPDGDTIRRKLDRWRRTPGHFIRDTEPAVGEIIGEG